MCVTKHANLIIEGYYELMCVISMASANEYSEFKMAAVSNSFSKFMQKTLKTNKPR